MSWPHLLRLNWNEAEMSKLQALSLSCVRIMYNRMLEHGR